MVDKIINNIKLPNGEVYAIGGGGSVIFDTKLTDHILTYEQSKGWALQGTYVYKEAVAGSRYGYPDFYAKCVEEKDLGTPTETVLGENTVTLYTNANGHAFYDIADKEAIDAWYNTYGIAWYYGVDTENERIFLPRTKWFIQPTGEITEVNSVNEAGLPNIEATLAINAPINSPSGAFYHTSTSISRLGGTQDKTQNSTGFDASKSNPTYGNSDTVQPPSINQLLYICVGNTNVESAVTDVVDVTTTENDTVPLFTGMYFDFTPNNVSWLRGGEQANSGGVYAFTYNELVNILNGETKYGDLKVIDVADMVTGEDYSLYWKVNQTDMTFITPIRTDERVLVEKKEPTEEDARWYNLYSDGWCEQGGGVESIIQTPSITYLKEYIDVGVSYTLLVTQAGGQASALGVYQQTPTGFAWTTTSGDRPAYWKASGYTTIPTNTNLYFKVANTVQNLELLDAGEVLEVLSTKTDKLQACEASFPSSKYIDLTLNASGSTYTAPANGWVMISKISTGANQIVEIGSRVVSNVYSTANNQGLKCSIPIKKGVTFYITYTAGGSVEYFRFIYAQGETV